MSIVYVGMDVHKNSFTLCGLYRNGETTRFLRNKQTNPSVDAVVRYVNEARKEFGEDVKVWYLAKSSRSPESDSRFG